MDEFTFLRSMFRRLSEAEGFQASAKSEEAKSASEAHALAVACSIRDYLKVRNSTEPKQ